MTKIIETQNILKLLPHRYPFLLVDRVLDYKEFDFLIAIKNVSMNEPYFNGHFPGEPVMPGVLMLEALAQASAILSNLSREPQEGHRFMYYFAGIDNVKFKKMVIPGDTMQLEVKMTAKKRNFWKLYGQATVDGQLACSADLLSAMKEVKSD